MQAVALLAQHKRNKHERTEADMTLNFTTHFDKKGVGGRLCLAEDEKASILCLHEAGNGIPFIKVGRLVRYRRSDLEAWLESRTLNNRGKGVG